MREEFPFEIVSNHVLEQNKAVETGASQYQTSIKPSGEQKSSENPKKIDAVNSENKTDSNILIQIENNTDYAIWDESKENVDATTNFDINNDGKLETATIGRDHPNGIRVVIIEGDTGYNLFVNEGEYFKAAFDDSGELEKEYYIQTSFFDLDKDVQKEVLLAIGNN